MVRSLFVGVGFVALVSATVVQAQSGGSYDWQTGSTQTWSADERGNAQVRGSNWGAGARWTTKIRPDGSAEGTDTYGNRWNHNAQSGYYYNFGTGQSCFQRGTAVNTC